jgi:hypothetical protein
MEITFFVLGMLTIILGALVATVVVGLLKITKLTKQVDELKRQHVQDVDGIYRHISDNQQGLWRQFENAGRDVTMVEKTIMNHIDAKQRELEQSIDQLHRIDHDLNENAKRYTDSRIDKLIDTYFDLIGDKIKEKKAIIKG